MLRRHSLVWLKDSADSPEHPGIAESWKQAGNPFVVCRTRPGEEVSLGFCLPPANAGQAPRLPFHCLASQIGYSSRPPGLSGAVELPLLKKFHNQLLLTPPAGVEVCVIGSAMWEMITGVRYLRESSDLDLVLDLQDPRFIEQAVRYLEHLASACALRMDAELSIPALGEIHWKEWRSESPEILVKSTGEPRMVSRSDLLALCGVL